MSLTSALELASMGFHVFPLIPNGKTPLIEDFPNQASTDPARIKKWWVDPVMEMEQPYNVGISTSCFNGGESGLVVIDEDNKGDKKGSEELAKLPEISETLVFKTPTGGRHHVYKCRQAVKQGVNVLAKGLDIRSKGGFIVAPGSTIDGKSYSVSNPSDIAECPNWVIDKCGKAHTKVVDEEFHIIDANEEHSIRRAKDYLTTAPPSIEGEGGNENAYKVLARVKDFGVPECEFLEVLEDWNNQCEPPWSLEDLQKLTQNVFKHGNTPPGELAPENDFDPVPDTSGSYLDQINNKFAIMYQGGTHSIVEEVLDDKKEIKLRQHRPETFKQILAHKTVTIDSKVQKQANIWLNWEGRKEYTGGWVFAPGRKVDPKFYNLFTGFKCKPKSYSKGSKDAQRGFDSFMAHGLENICGGDKDDFDWLMNYFAHLIQKPYEKPLTALVFKGEKGVGKNALMSCIYSVIGYKYTLETSSMRHLVSNFNAHLEYKLIVTLDEAVWAGDKTSEGQLKTFITASDMNVEHKGKESYQAKSYTRTVIIGNEDWLVPATFGERRFAVFNVGEKRRLDNMYFKDMRICISKKGGNSLLLDYFLNYKLDEDLVNVAPITDALMEQKEESLNPAELFWRECLMEGRIVSSDFEEEWQEKLSKDRVMIAFNHFAKENNLSIKYWTKSKLTRELKKIANIDGRGKMSVEGLQKICYTVPPLDQCRQAFDKKMGKPLDWPTV